MRDILAVLLVLSLAGVGLQSCRLGQAERAADRITERLAVCRGSLTAADAALASVDEQAADNIAAAEARIAAAQDAASRAEQAEQESAARLAATNRALRDATRDPGCAEQLEVQLCPAIPLL